jgi:hypothetical protein
VFSQLLQLFSRLDFEKAVKETRAERHARGDVDYAWFAALTLQGVFFVTRLKDHAVYTVVGIREVSARPSAGRSPTWWPCFSSSSSPTGTSGPG